MFEVNADLAKALFDDAQHALDYENSPAASIEFIEYADTMVVVVTFTFAATQLDGPLRGSRFRFFLNGFVQNLNWERDEEFAITGRDHGFEFSFPGFNPDEDPNDDELDYFVDTVRAFVIESTKNSGATLDDRLHA